MNLALLLLKKEKKKIYYNRDFERFMRIVTVNKNFIPRFNI